MTATGVRTTVTHDPDRRREIAHVGPVELCTPVLEASRDFFVHQMGLREVHRDANSVYLHTWDDYQSWTLVYTEDWTGTRGRLHHIAFATDTREEILRAADVCLDAGVHIETGPHKHAIQQTFFLYVWEPGGNRIELCNAGARLILAPDWRTISWTAAERAKGQAWGLKTIDTFHTHGTPVVP